MLRGISELLPPVLVMYLMEMGHGDELVLGDCNFPAYSHGKRVVRCDGIRIPALLDALIPLFPLDEAVEHNAVLMAVPEGIAEPAVWSDYAEILQKSPDRQTPFLKLAKPEFYRRSAEAYAVIASGERERFANLILRKGIVKAEELPRY